MNSECQLDFKSDFFKNIYLICWRRCCFQFLEGDDVVEVSTIEELQYPFSVIQFARSQTFNIGIKPTTQIHVIIGNKNMRKEKYDSLYLRRSKLENQILPVWAKKEQ